MANGSPTLLQWRRPATRRPGWVSSTHRVCSCPATLSFVDSDKSTSTSTEMSRTLRTLRIMMRGSGCWPMRSSIHRGQAIAALMSMSSPSSSLRMRCTPWGCMASSRILHAPDQAACARPRCRPPSVGVSRLRVALFQHRHPGGALQLNLVVPLGVVARGRMMGSLALPSALKLLPLLTSPMSLVGKQLGAQHPDFLGVVPGGFHVHLVGKLHQVHVLCAPA